MRILVCMAAMGALLLAWTLEGRAADQQKPRRPGMVLGAVTVEDKARQEEAARAYFTDLEVVTQDGRRLRFYSDVLKGHVVVISFVQAQCKNACPMITRKLTLVRDQMDGYLGHPIQFVTISLNPAQDTAVALKAFARRHEADHDGWLFLTGDQVTAITRKLGQYAADLEDHSTMVLAGNVDQAHWIKIPPNAMPDSIAAKVRELMANSPAAPKG